MQLNLFHYLFLASLAVFASTSCKQPEKPVYTYHNPYLDGPKELVEGEDYFLPHIDLSTWKVTLPIGRPTEILPPEILDYATNETLQPFMYNDSTDGSLVFYTYPGATTKNTSYSRTELRELMDGGVGKVNWTFAQGGKMRARLKLEEITQDADDKYHRTIILQIHGRLTDEQRALIGKDDNNAPPILKIYWANGRIRVKTKVLKDTTMQEPELLYTESWGDDDGVYFDEYVGFEPFTIEVIVSEGRMTVQMNDDQMLVYEGIHIDKWSPFENYFKAGNYLASIDEGAFAKVKFYELEVSH
ncbi:polysaccharide lyase family 7 protein [Pontibacter sp. G13]|uniref:polysaccharide lyase family 7 protein n=1 Tax=Pontibacter sp. G13 TaxID=3074898 RepID=UPI002889A41A|nr:polysaccharide lyase family 7 protein [Pontibacter sp. G13]WNJ18675.1 polysaccharide lyase family 7 protein [Pontibacter sp. G13]